MTQFDLSIVVPAYNESDIITETLAQIADYCDQHHFGSVELVVVAAGNDDTPVKARQLADRFAGFQLIEPESKVGKGRDVRLGMQAARGAKQIFMDADLSTPLHHVEAAVAALDTAAVVIGVRHLHKIHHGLVRSAISLGGNLLIRLVFASGIRDTQCGFKGFTYEASRKLFSEIENTGWGFDIEMLQRAKEAHYQVAQLPIDDWREARSEGDLRGESSIMAALRTFRELWVIRFGAWLRSLRGHVRSDFWAVWLGLSLFALLATYQLSKHSIWFDEAFGTYMMQFSWADIARYTAADVHPPMYYWLLKAWTSLFGSTEVTVRLLSVVCGIVTVGIGFALVRRLFGRRAAWIALALLVVSPMLLRYSQEARMYTLVTAIALGATYALVRAYASRGWQWWVLYGVLIALGMWTHYFTALIWLTHWAWRAMATRAQGLRGRDWWRAFFNKAWLLTHALAIGLFLPWLPFMVLQLGGIQGGGFWIGPVGIDTPTNYITNVFYYREHSQIAGWWAMGILVLLSSLALLWHDSRRRLARTQRRWWRLLVALAVLPVVILFVASLPPLKSSYVERYLLTAMVSLPLVVGVIAAWSRRSLWLRSGVIVLYIGLSLVGVWNVYRLGNYNKNTNTDIRTNQLMRSVIARAQPSEPIVADSPWLFYEAVFYETPEHPVYFMDEKVEYLYGSLDMLKYNDQHKIKSLQDFSRAHDTIWYVGTSKTSLKAPIAQWKETQRLSIESAITYDRDYQAVRFSVE